VPVCPKNLREFARWFAHAWWVTAKGNFRKPACA